MGKEAAGRDLRLVAALRPAPATAEWQARSYPYQQDGFGLTAAGAAAMHLYSLLLTVAD